MHDEFNTSTNFDVVEKRKRFTTNQNMIKLIAAAIPKYEVTHSSQSLLWFVKSFDCRVESVDQLNSSIVENLANIQYYVYANTEAPSRYTNIRKAIDYIVDENEEETILGGGFMALKSLASKFVNNTFSKKLGKKFISNQIKSTIKLFQNGSVQYYSKFISLQKPLAINPETSYLDPFFKNFFRPQPPPPLVLNHSIKLDMSTVATLNHTLNEHLMYNLNVNPKNDAISTLLEQKIWLVSTELVARYVARFQSSIEGIVKGSRMVVNTTETVHHRMLFMLDFDFQGFISGLVYWWKFYHTVDDLNVTHMGCPGENYSAHNIIIDKECMAMFRLPPVDNYNETLILAYTLNTHFNHVKIVMTICHHPFTTKTNLKFTLTTLINQKYIISHQIHKKTIYTSENLPKIKSAFSKHYDTTIHRIMNITKDEYLATAMQHSLPTTLWENTNPLLHTPSYINKTYLFTKSLKKTIFITSFLNTFNIDYEHHDNRHIHTEYTQNLQTYKQH